MPQSRACGQAGALARKRQERSRCLLVESPGLWLRLGPWNHLGSGNCWAVSREKHHGALSDQHGLKFPSYHLRAAWPSASHLTLLSLLSASLGITGMEWDTVYKGPAHYKLPFPMAVECAAAHKSVCSQKSFFFTCLQINSLLWSLLLQDKGTVSPHPTPDSFWFS